MLKSKDTAASSNVLGHARFGKSKKMNGRAILEKLTSAIKECKKASAFWISFLVADEFPSGLDEDDMLKLIIYSMCTEWKGSTDLTNDEDVDEMFGSDSKQPEDGEDLEDEIDEEM